MNDTHQPASPPMGQPVAQGSPATPSTSSTSTIVALVLGILSLVCCGFFAGIPAIIMGRSELKAIAEGRVHASNQSMAKIGMVLGIIGTALSCLGALFYIILFAFGFAQGFR